MAHVEVRMQLLEDDSLPQTCFYWSLPCTVCSSAPASRFPLALQMCSTNPAFHVGHRNQTYGFAFVMQVLLSAGPSCWPHFLYCVSDQTCIPYRISPTFHCHQSLQSEWHTPFKVSGFFIQTFPIPVQQPDGSVPAPSFAST